MAGPLDTAVARRDLAALRRALRDHDGPVPPRAVVAAAGLAWQTGLAALVAAGADLNGSYRNYRPLHALIQEDPHKGGVGTPERVACLEWLLAHGADPDEAGAWPSARALIVAAFTGEAAYVTVLKRRYPRPDMFVAAALGRAKRVAALLAGDGRLANARDHDRLTPLQCCAGSRMGRADAKTAAGLLKVARALVEAGADVNARTRSWGHDVAVSCFAIRSGQIDLLAYLLAHGLDPTPALVTAAWDGQFDVVDLLLERGGVIDEAREGARPLLNELIRWGQFTAARALLERGASPNVADDRGWTALHQAASRGNAGLIRDLLDAGADRARRAADGRTPRHVARRAAIRALL